MSSANLDLHNQNLAQRDWNYYWELGLKTVKELETDQGILASARHEWYGAIFGRDSLITSLKLLRVYQHTGIVDFLNTVRKVLLTLADLQGQVVNVESGEEPGKCIHEYRPEKHEYLTRDLPQPWYVYPDSVMRNYDTVDATSLFLITAYRYHQLSRDTDFLIKIMPHIRLSLEWTFKYGDSNGDGFIDYQIPPGRTYGGLINHNWMDSADSVFHEDGAEVVSPIAPVEVQAYTYLALRLWSRYFANHNNSYYRELEKRADKLKKDFNDRFLVKDSKLFFASAVDGASNQVRTIRSSVGHCLWAAMNLNDDQVLDGIIDNEFVEPIVKRLMASDMFEPEAGIRTLSILSSRFNPNSYHNGSIWPHDNSLIAEGFDNYGFKEEAQRVRAAMLKAVAHFDTPIELFVYDKTYSNYLDHRGRSASRSQAWTAAALLTSVAPEYKSAVTPKQPTRELPQAPYKLVGFNLPHALQMSVLVDKLKVKDKVKIGSKNLNGILKTVAQIKALNALEKLRQEKLIPYRDKLLKNQAFNLITDKEKGQMRKILKTIREKISL